MKRHNMRDGTALATQQAAARQRTCGASRGGCRCSCRGDVACKGLSLSGCQTLCTAVGGLGSTRQRRACGQQARSNKCQVGPCGRPLLVAVPCLTQHSLEQRPEQSRRPLREQQLWRLRRQRHTPGRYLSTHTQHVAKRIIATDPCRQVSLQAQSCGRSPWTLTLACASATAVATARAVAEAAACAAAFTSAAPSPVQA